MKYIKIVLWRVVKRLSLYIEEARCLKVNSCVCCKVNLILVG